VQGEEELADGYKRAKRDIWRGKWPDEMKLEDHVLVLVLVCMLRLRCAVRGDCVYGTRYGDDEDEDDDSSMCLGWVTGPIECRAGDGAEEGGTKQKGRAMIGERLSRGRGRWC
jgi:hypothetical protein